MTLSELAAKYGTDKLNHGYMPFYERHLPESPKKLLEIGVKDGNSIRMWQEYFPNTEIHGLDLFSEFTPSIPGVKLWQGNQLDYKILEELRNEDFDVIIDDGSHNSRDQMITFFGLFNGKHYFIEDLHCCADPFYRQGLPIWTAADALFSNISYANKKCVYMGIDIYNEKNIKLIIQHAD